MTTRKTAVLLRAAALGLTVLAGGAACRPADRHDAADRSDTMPDASDDALDEGDDFDDAS
jgi:hypothetical protein